MLRQSPMALVTTLENVEVVGEAAGVTEATAGVDEWRSHAGILDVRTPGGGGGGVLKDLVRRAGEPTRRKLQTETSRLRRLGEPAAAETGRSWREGR